jgi:hypothetical protein
MIRRIGLIMAHAAILSTAASDPEQNYYSDQIIENVQIKLTIEGRPVTVRLTKGALGRLSSRVFQIEVDDEHEACQLATTTNLAIGPCSFESPREHEQRNVFFSRNSSAQQSEKRAYFPLPMTHTTPRHALDLDLHAIPRKPRQGVVVKDKTLLEAATAQAREDEGGTGVRSMVADYRYQAVKERHSTKV